jgi:choline-sulfatase
MSPAPDRPNILILMVDQLTGIFWTEGPAAFLDVPHLRALHERSVNCSSCYTPSPLCTPARASFMTGLLPSSTTVYDNAAEFPSSLPTYAHYLRRAGWYTALSGKMHFVGADQLHGFEDRLTTDIYPADFGWTPDWERPLERVDWWYHNLSSVTEAGVAHTSNQLEYDDEVAYHARARLLQLARGKDERPFCLTVSFTHPHDPYTCRPEQWARYDGVDIPAPTTQELAAADQDPHTRRLYGAVDAERFNVTDAHVAAARRAYCANISYLDDKIGELLTTLEGTGLADNTVVVFCADHGDMLGERGLWYKMNFFEGAARVPLSIAFPDGRGAGLSIDDSTSAMDVVPTLLDIAGVSADDVVLPFDGQSLMPMIDGAETPKRVVAAEYMAEGSVSSMVMLREGRYKYCYCAADPEQLYDIANDPAEQHNLVGNPDSLDVLERFRARLDSGWSLEALDADVRENQRRRILCYQALREGRYTPWDHEPRQDAAERFMRNHLDLNEVEAGSRVPAQDR